MNEIELLKLYWRLVEEGEMSDDRVKHLGKATNLTEDDLNRYRTSIAEVHLNRIFKDVDYG